MGWFDWLVNSDTTSDNQQSFEDLVPKELRREIGNLLEDSPSNRLKPKWPKDASSVQPHSSSPDSSPNPVEVGREKATSSDSLDGSSDPSKPAWVSLTRSPDCRYAELWSTYRPLEQENQAMRSYSSGLSELSADLKRRLSAVEEAAQRNCALESLAVADCFRKGSFSELLTMCREKCAKRDRCIDFQRRFLKALGHMVVDGHEIATREEIEIKADDLYREMISKLETLDSKATTSTEHRGEPRVSASPNPSSPSDQVSIRPEFSEFLAKLPKRLSQFQKEARGKTPAEIELLEMELRGEMIYHKQSREKFAKILELEREQRAERRRQGRSGFGDIILDWAGFNRPRPEDDERS